MIKKLVRVARVISATRLYERDVARMEREFAIDVSKSNHPAGKGRPNEKSK